MFKSIGKIKYDTSGGYRLTVEIDWELGRYYRSQIPKYIRVNAPRYPPHITVVRLGKEIPPNLKPWGKYKNERVEFFYEHYLHQGKIYFWLNVWCIRLEQIREELGLPVISQYTIPPEGFKKCFHATIANMKEDPNQIVA